MKIVARSKEYAPGMVWMDEEEEQVIGKKVPTSNLYFKETNINAKAATVGHDGKVYIIDAVDNKLKVYDDIADTSKVTEGITWTGYGNPIQMRVTSKGVVVFATYGNPSKVYFLETINSTPILVHEEYDSGWTKDYGVDAYDNGLDSFIFAASYNSSDTPPNAIFSRDGGRTFEIVKTCKPLVEGAPNNHFHDCAIDPYSGWLWLIEGDIVNADIWYSVDLGVTWNNLELTDYRQPTVIIPFAENILMGRDDGFLRPGVDVLKKPLTSLEIEDPGKNHKSLKVLRNDVFSAHYFARSPISKGEEGYMRFEGGGSEIIYLGTGDGGKTAHVVGFGNGLKGLFGMDNNYVYGFSENQQRIVYSNRVIWG